MLVPDLDVQGFVEKRLILRSSSSQYGADISSRFDQLVHLGFGQSNRLWYRIKFGFGCCLLRLCRVHRTHENCRIDSRLNRGDMPCQLRLGIGNLATQQRTTGIRIVSILRFEQNCNGLVSMLPVEKG
ncbi:hypothetical protein [Nocardia sp. NPDC049149]|uniref:hypothetical protein n=1 Tax=Nocardia sp. NPDC049149 TaxID=3364315 RepID=UPI00370FFF9C